MLYLSRATLREHAAADGQFWSWARDAYDVHRAIWRLFAAPKVDQRDFLFRLEQRNGRSCVYTLSARRPRDEHGVWTIDTKEFAPKLRAGDRVMFDLRVNPVVSRSATVGERGQRHDVVMDAKKQGSKGEPEPEIVQQAGARWLASREEALGIVVEPTSLRADGYRQFSFRKPKGKGRVRISTIDFQGKATVRDPARLVEAIAAGIGPAKAFGCGLLLIKPAG